MLFANAAYFAYTQMRKTIPKLRKKMFCNDNDIEYRAAFFSVNGYSRRKNPL